MRFMSDFLIYGHYLHGVDQVGEAFTICEQVGRPLRPTALRACLQIDDRISAALGTTVKMSGNDVLLVRHYSQPHENVAWGSGCG